MTSTKPFTEQKNEAPRYELSELQREQNYGLKSQPNQSAGRLGKSIPSTVSRKSETAEVGQFFGHSRFDSDLSRGDDACWQLEEHGKITGKFAELDSGREN